MKRNRASRKDSTFTRPLKLCTQLALLGLGLGVIVGSTIRTIALQEKDSQLISLSWFSRNQISFPSIFKFEAINSQTREKKILKPNPSLRKTEISSLSQRWRKLASSERDLEASGFIIFLDDKRFAQLSPNTELPAASTIKIPILLVALKMIDKGQLNWNEKLELNKSVLGSGAGWMAYQPLGKFFPIHEVATEMIRVSDNTATNLLIQRIGGIQILNQQFNELGLYSTEVKNLLPDLEGTNTTSVKDLTRALAIVDGGEVLKPRTRDLFREVMGTSRTNQLLPGGLLRGLGIEKKEIDYQLLLKGYRVYNKTGDIGITYADAGLIQMPDTSRAVAGFIVKGPFNDPRSPELIRKMAAAMVPFLNGKSSKTIQD
ncbi:serine hydrolase [Prochlorococcus sp. MIT 1307]|uniref:serine hydrolase n=1 Tax=Prochlorococcus sp. MIT 1307 TaxID=3096219 RepID=UPI002A760D9E|nr:serine hydrolase [Prochlorococcus sp. MIT 1307]